MKSEDRSPLASTKWLAQHQDDRDGYMEGHIRGAVLGATVDEMSDPNHAYPDMLAGVSSEREIIPPSRLVRVVSDEAGC